MAWSDPIALWSGPMIRAVAFPDGTDAPALGQGTWRMGEDARRRQQEIGALRAGVDLGMTLIDTAEMYGDGAAEELLGEALAGVRDQVFLVSKVYPQNAGGGRIERACEASLKRLNMPVMAYSPIAQGRLPGSGALARAAASEHGEGGLATRRREVRVDLGKVIGRQGQIGRAAVRYDVGLVRGLWNGYDVGVAEHPGQGDLIGRGAAPRSHPRQRIGARQASLGDGAVGHDRHVQPL